jgi:hypothetical protein
MPRTTVNIDTAILSELKRLQKQERKPLGRLISDLLGDALARRRSAKQPPAAFRWVARSMKARVDLADKDAVYAALEDLRPRR